MFCSDDGRREGTGSSSGRLEVEAAGNARRDCADDENADVSEALINKLDEVKQHQQMTQFDVKIGAGMDIAIHGENGKSLTRVTTNEAARRSMKNVNQLLYSHG